MSAITEFKQKLVALYQSKSESEQRLIAILGICFAAFIVVSIFTTVIGGKNEVADKLNKQVELNVWAAQQIQLIKSNGNSDNATSNQGSMTQIINNTARQSRITLARLQPQTTDAVKVGLDDIEFNVLMNWLAVLKNNYAIEVNNIDISRTDKTGIVRVRRLDLERS